MNVSELGSSLDGLVLAGDGAGVDAVFAGLHGHVGVPREVRREDGPAAFEEGGHFHFDAAVGGLASEDGGGGAHRAEFCFVVFLVVADGVEKIVVLDLVGVLFTSGVEAPCVATGGADDVAIHTALSLRADDVFADGIPAADDVAAEAGAAAAVCVFKLDGVMVKDFAVVLTLADFASAHARCFNGVSFFHPVDDVNVVDVLLDDVIAANP